MATVDEKLEPILAQVLQRNPAEPEFHQAVREVLHDELNVSPTYPKL